MHYIVAGGTGFIGQALIAHYLKAGIDITVLGRSQAHIQACFQQRVKALTWEQLPTLDLNTLQQTQLIINLSGANISSGRWTAARRQELLNSRIHPTEQLAALCTKLGKDAPALFNASGIGIYGSQAATTHTLPPAYDEQTPLDDYQHAPDFLAELSRAWEHATQVAREASVRVVNLRLGVVLSQRGGALEQIRRPFDFYLGGPLGTGQQAFSWIALKDVIRAVDFLITHPEIEGPVNLVAPECVTQAQLAATIGKILHRPSYFKIPASILKLLFGRLAQELLLSGQHVSPQRLLDAGFNFEFADLHSALTDSLLNKFN